MTDNIDQPQCMNLISGVFRYSVLKVRHWEDQLLARGPPTVGVPGREKNDHF